MQRWTSRVGHARVWLNHHISVGSGRHNALSGTLVQSKYGQERSTWCRRRQRAAE
jgi:hypothetical protein